VQLHGWSVIINVYFFLGALQTAIRLANFPLLRLAISCSSALTVNTLGGGKEEVIGGRGRRYRHGDKLICFSLQSNLQTTSYSISTARVDPQRKINEMDFAYRESSNEKLTN
jgi:hypothetical protein